MTGSFDRSKRLVVSRAAGEVQPPHSVYNQRGDVTLTGCTLSNNFAAYEGGAVYTIDDAAPDHRRQGVIAADIIFGTEFDA
jgi:hypothetical protein